MVVPLSPILSVDHVDRIFGDRRVLNDLSFSVDPGHRLGLIGENGAGKSTLLRLLAGIDEPQNGTIIRPPDIGYLNQDPQWDSDLTVNDVLERALTTVHETEAELMAASTGLERGTAEARDAYAAALTRAELADVWTIDQRVERTLNGLGLSALSKQRLLSTLSGGQVARLGIAALLIRQPSGLLLDEPTNHLDDDAIEFLAQHLRALPGVVVVSSHDRRFLQDTCTDILDLDPPAQEHSVYGGDFEHYVEHKHKERLAWEQRWQADQDEITRLRHGVASTKSRVPSRSDSRDRNTMGYKMHGMRVEQHRSKKVRAAQRQLDTTVQSQVRKPPPVLRFTSPWEVEDGTQIPSLHLISVRKAVVPGRVNIPSFDLALGDHYLLTGPNGAGKTSFLLLLAQRLSPATGTVTHTRGLRVGALDQQESFADDKRTSRQIFAAATAERPPSVTLHDLGLLSEIDRPVHELSVGQRKRLALAIIIAREPHVLLLDEPSNHISALLADELVNALLTAPPAVVLASHDRWLREHWTQSRIDMVNGRVCNVEQPLS